MLEQSDQRTGDRLIPGWPAALTWHAATGGLIGREPELSVIEATVKDLAAGRGRSVWIEGEPGIGKTAFLGEALRRINVPRGQVYAARAEDAIDFFPLRALLDALRIHPAVTDPRLAEIADRLWGSGTGDPIRPGNSVAAAAEMLLLLVDRLCAVDPMILVVDDMQWADDATVAVWGRLDAATQQLPLLLVAAARPVPRRQEIDRLRRQSTSTGGVNVVLDRLDEDQVGHLVQRIASAPPSAEVRSLVRQAGGNPLYVRELVGALLGGNRVRLIGGVLGLSDGHAAVPKSLAAAIATKLNYLSDSTVRILRSAAILGAEFRLDHLSLLVGQTPTALAEAVDEARSAGVLAELDVGYSFRHSLIHSALYESTPAPMRSVLHQRAAQVLSEAGSPDEAIFVHLQAAPGPVGLWVIDWLVRASPTLTTRAPRAAAQLLRRVREQLDGQDPRRLELDGYLSDALFSQGDYDEFQRIAVPLTVDASDPQIIGRMTWLRTRAFLNEGRHQEAMDLEQSALSGAGLIGKWRARMLAMQAVTHIELGQLDEAIAAARLAETEGDQVGDRVAIGWALCAFSRATGIAAQDGAAVVAAAERGLAIVGDEPASIDLQLLLRALQVTGLFNLHQPEEAIRAMGQALTLAERAGSPARLAVLRVQAAELNFLGGRWDDALPELEAAAEVLTRQHPARAMVAGVGTLIAVHRGDDALIERFLSTGDELVVDPAGMSENLRAARALISERQGRPSEALRLMLDLLDPAGSLTFPGLSPNRCILATILVRLALELGHPDVAEACASACLEEATVRPDHFTVAGATHCDGLISQDAAPLQRAARMYGETGCRHMRAAALADAAFAMGAHGDIAGARKALTEATDTYSKLDAFWDIRAAEARARGFGIRLGVRGERRRPATGWAALTRTELAVATLVAGGRSNPEIASELYMSRSTVQTHVSHILAKLACRSRREVEAFVRNSD